MDAAAQTHSSSRGALGTGIYPAAEAARLAQLEPQRLRRWVEGYTFRSPAGERRTSNPVFKSEARRDGKHRLELCKRCLHACTESRGNSATVCCTKRNGSASRGRRGATGWPTYAARPCPMGLMARTAGPAASSAVRRSNAC